MLDPTEPFDFPDLPDEAVIAINDFLEELYTCFQNHYFAQMRRYDCEHAARKSQREQIPLPLPDPPF